MKKVDNITAESSIKAIDYILSKTSKPEKDIKMHNAIAKLTMLKLKLK